MNETARLEAAIAKLSTCRDWQRRALEKEILLRSTRVSEWITRTTDLLTKQLRWLDTQLDSPTYEQRFAEWKRLLTEYERACDALAAANALRIGVAA